MAECRSCHAPIVWATSSATGRAMPVDREPNPNGNIILGDLDGEHEAIVLAGDKLATARHEYTTLYLNHYASCKDAQEWRERSQKRAEHA